MSIFGDIVDFTSVLKMSYNFLAGNAFLKKKKLREKKKLVSVAMPYADLACAAGAVPVFPVRLHVFDINKYLLAMNTATTFFGWSTVVKFLGFVKQFDAFKIADNIVGDLVNSINMKYNEMYDVAEANGMSTDFCYGLKAMYGMHITKGQSLDANLNFTIRCSAWNKYLEALKTLLPNSRQIWIEIPPRDFGNATIEILKENLSQGILELEELTGNNVTDNSLTKQFRIRNQICRYYKTILYDISASDFYPCNPATFAEILSLLSISFQDYNSDANRYLENISQLVKEMKERIRKGIGMDVTNMPRILLTPMFGGWEPLSHEYIYELGGRLLYADWDLPYMLEEIDVSGDPLDGYARFLMNMTTKGFSCDNSLLTDAYMRVAKKLKIDGLVFNQLFGCHSISNCYSMLKEKLRREDIPSTVINFNKLGDKLDEQVKTRLEALMEMVKR